MNDGPPLRERDAPEEAPPILGSWRNIYLFVLGELALIVVLFVLLRRWAS